MKRLTLIMLIGLIAILAGCSKSEAVSVDGGVKPHCDASQGCADASGPWYDAGLDAGDAGDAMPDFPDASKPDGWPGDQTFTPVSCDDDCEIAYTLYYRFSGHGGYPIADAAFKVAHGGADIAVEELSQARDIMYMDMSSYSFFTNGQLSHTRLTLAKDARWSLKSGSILLTNSIESLSATRNFTFSYDAGTQLLAVTVESSGARWTTSVPCASAPVPMIGYEDYPLPAYGNYSPLFSLLVGKAYDWQKGGVQSIPMFLPETLRIVSLDVEQKPDENGKKVLQLSYGDDVKWYTVDIPDGGMDLFNGGLVNQMKMTFDLNTPILAGTRSVPTEWEATGNTFNAENNVPEDTGTYTDVTEPVLPKGFTEENFEVVPDGGVTIAGSVDIPSGASHRPAVIMVPGLSAVTRNGESRRFDFYRHLAANLAHANYVVFRYDNRGCGASDGDFSGMTVEQAAFDLTKIFQYAASRSEVDAAKIVILARGEGSIPSIAADAPAAGSIFISPVADSIEAAEVYRNRVPFDKLPAESGGGSVADRFEAYVKAILASITNGTFADPSYLGRSVATWKSLLGADATADLSGLSGTPILILRGALDLEIPASQPDHLASKAKKAGAVVTQTLLPNTSFDLRTATESAAALWPEFGQPATVTSEAVQTITQWLDAKVSK